MRQRFKIGFVMLLSVTIVWTLAWHQHMTAYNQMRREELERFLEWLEEHEEEIEFEWGLEKPQRWLHYGYGPFLVTSGLIICVAWLFFLKGTFEEWRKDKVVKDEKVGFVAEILKALAYLAIPLFFFIITFFAPLIFQG